MDALVLPSNIPWPQFKGEILEEFMFWLLDEMGAKNIQWRKGGKKVTSADGGRDIEAIFHVATPDGEMDKQQWWVEIKGRTNTLEISVVQEAILNASGKKDVDILVVVTNTQFSNPTRDWVSEWQKEHPRPKVRLWDKDALERMVVKHPSVVYRFCPESLSDQGRLEAFQTRFWNQLYFPGEIDLAYFWNKRYDIEWSSEALIMVIAGEIVNGNINKRPWITALSKEDLANLLILSIVNYLVLLVRSEKYGIDSNFISQLVVYIVIGSLIFLPLDFVSEIMDDPWKYIDGLTTNEKVRDMVLNPVFWRLFNELTDVCVDDCNRVMTDSVLFSSKDISQYWNRFTQYLNDNDKKEQCSRLIIETHCEQCKVGFELNADNSCPLFEYEKLSIKNKLSIARKITIERLKNYIESVNEMQR